MTEGGSAAAALGWPIRQGAPALALSPHSACSFAALLIGSAQVPASEAPRRTLLAKRLCLAPPHPVAMSDPAAPAGEGHPASPGDHGRVFLTRLIAPCHHCPRLWPASGGDWPSKPLARGDRAGMTPAGGRLPAPPPTVAAARRRLLPHCCQLPLAPFCRLGPTCGTTSCHGCSHWHAGAVAGVCRAFGASFPCLARLARLFALPAMPPIKVLIFSPCLPLAAPRRTSPPPCEQPWAVGCRSLELLPVRRNRWLLAYPPAVLHP